MDEIENLIKDEKHKSEISKHLYERLYTRFLKIFDYANNDKKEYTKQNKTVNKNVFKEEYKNGFLMMVSCALLIETFASFLEGHNETPRGKNAEMYKKVFERAKEKQNPLEQFINKNIYKHIRCGLLHQGETTGSFKITRKNDEELLSGNTINAQKFFNSLKELLQEYKKELELADWNGKEWDACRMKIRHIISNSN